MLRYTTDRARPGLVALYDIRPGNGAGQFLQPRSPHGAQVVLGRNVGRRMVVAQSNLSRMGISDRIAVESSGIVVVNHRLRRCTVGERVSE